MMKKKMEKRAIRSCIGLEKDLGIFNSHLATYAKGGNPDL